MEPTEEPRRQELQMAKPLMQSLAEDNRLDDQRDHYHEALDTVASARLVLQQDFAV